MSALSCRDDDTLSNYIGYPTGGSLLEFYMNKSIGNDWDDVSFLMNYIMMTIIANLFFSYN